MFKYAENTRVIRNSKIEKSILLNRENGVWIKIPNIWVNILEEFLESSDELEEYLNRFEDSDNAKTFSSLLDTVINYELVVKVGNEKKGKLHKVQFAISERCNLFCKHCCYNATVKEKNTDLPLDEIKKILDKIISCEPESITLSGGEPLIRKDFYDILKYLANNYSGEITLSTNATLIREKDIPILADIISSFDISLDGFDETSCEQIRGKGVFQKVVSNIKKMQERGIKNINLSMVDVNHSKVARDKFRDLNKKLGTRPIIRTLAPIGRASTMETKIEYLKKMYTPREITKQETKEICAGFRGTKCGAYRNQFFVDYNGDIYPCGLLINKKYKMGNILKMGEEVFPFPNRSLLAQENLIKLEPDKIKTCKECKVNFFCWGCLQEADMMAEDSELIKAKCALQYKHINNIIWGEESSRYEY